MIHYHYQRHQLHQQWLEHHLLQKPREEQNHVRPHTILLPLLLSVAKEVMPPTEVQAALFQKWEPPRPEDSLMKTFGGRGTVREVSISEISTQREREREREKTNMDGCIGEEIETIRKICYCYLLSIKYNKVYSQSTSTSSN
mmetsp:Transcript_18370/g.26379  ORF Transcript_18370/g.26379 Transcript_18370/m.26379 type:complete len:142 (-) Transcript_18370:175-600(-)